MRGLRSGEDTAQGRSREPPRRRPVVSNLRINETDRLTHVMVQQPTDNPGNSMTSSRISDKSCHQVPGVGKAVLPENLVNCETRYGFLGRRSRL